MSYSGKNVYSAGKMSDVLRGGALKAKVNFFYRCLGNNIIKLS